MVHADSLLMQETNRLVQTETGSLLNKDDQKPLLMNHLWPEYYPEFEKKNALKVLLAITYLEEWLKEKGDAPISQESE